MKECFIRPTMHSYTKISSVSNSFRDKLDENRQSVRNPSHSRSQSSRFWLHSWVVSMRNRGDLSDRKSNLSMTLVSLRAADVVRDSYFPVHRNALRLRTGARGLRSRRTRTSQESQCSPRWQGRPSFDCLVPRPSLPRCTQRKRFNHSSPNTRVSPSLLCEKGSAQLGMRF